MLDAVVEQRIIKDSNIRDDGDPGDLETTKSRRVDPLAKDRKAARAFIQKTIQDTVNFQEVCEKVKGRLNPALSHRLQITSEVGIKLPVDIKSYRGTEYVVGIPPKNPALFREIHYDVTYSYDLDGEERRAGSIAAVEVDRNNRVTRVWAKTDDALREFQNHLNGITISEEQFDRLCDLNNRLVDSIRAHPPFKDKLEEFKESREFQEEWMDRAKLAYFNTDPNYGFRLDLWARQNGFTNEELYLTGWYEKSVSKAGIVSYTPSYSDVVVIPDFVTENDIGSWRLRVVNPKDGDPKYRDSPARREVYFKIPEAVQVRREMFNAHNAPKARGQRICITEGEFKGIVTTELTDVVTSCITGISLISDAMIREIIAANPNEIVICLDRDPIMMALERVDGITDSQRAAYILAKRFRRAGAKNVRIAVLPDVKGGAKVGLDDYLLIDPENAKEKMRKLMYEARTIEEYRSEFNIDDTLQVLYERRSALRATKKKLLNATSRGAADLISQADAKRLIELAEAAERAFKLHLNIKYRASSLDRAHAELFPIPSIGKIHATQIKSAVTGAGVNIPMSRFTGPMHMTTVVPDDAGVICPRMFKDLAGRLQGRNGDGGEDEDVPNARRHGNHAHEQVYTGTLRAPCAWRNLRKAYFRDGAYERLPESVRDDIQTGIKLLYPAFADQSPDEQLPNLGYHRFINAYLAGVISRTAGDHYNFHADVELRVRRGEYQQVATTCDLMLTSKTSGMVRGIFFFPKWYPEQKVGDAVWKVAKARAATRAFTRDPSLESQRENHTKLADMLWSPHEMSETATALSALGVSQETVKDRKLRYIKAEEWPRIIKHLREAGILLEAYHEDLVRMEDNINGPVGRFSGDIILAPHADSDGGIRGFLVIPLEELALTSVSPRRHPANVQVSGQSMATSIDPSARLYGDDQLPEAHRKGNKVCIALDPIDMLLLQQRAIEDKNYQNATYISLYGDCGARDRAIRNVQKYANGEATILCYPYNNTAYDFVAEIDGVPGYLRELLDLSIRFGRHNGKDHPETTLKATLLEKPLAYSQVDGTWLTDSKNENLLEDGQPVEDLVTAAGVDIEIHKGIIAPLVRRITTLDAYLANGKGGVIPGYDRDLEFVRELIKIYTDFSLYVEEKSGKTMPTLGRFLEERYGISGLKIQDLIDGNVSIALPKVYDPESLLTVPSAEAREYIRTVFGRQPEAAQ